MKREIMALVSGLEAMKNDGVEGVFVSDKTLRALRNAVESRRLAPQGPRENTKAAPGRGQTETELPAEHSDNADASVPSPPEDRSRRAKTPARKKPLLPEPPQVDLPDGDKMTRWKALRKQVLECPVCREHVRPQCKVVFGVGDVDADIFFVGEAPGAEEEVVGEPFVGPAGQLLTRMIGAMGLRREDVYIGNVMNWRPETPSMNGNRPPTQEEMRYCLSFLKAQIAVVQPKVLVTLGATAVNGLFGPEPRRRMGDIRGKWLEFEGIPTMVTYHPSYVLRYDSPAVKRRVWEDLLLVMEKAGMPISEKQRRYFKSSL